ncbi:SH3 domain-containing protein [Peribacillus simplex]|uniref:SH3 domain-containing protein n=2 Tax=Peribacillus TaxID=2675229 RepID=A0AA90PB98_9BACI|nr:MULTISPECIES: SH3 domain-containing protein [Peribacillus]MDP1417407.1 SH3 domain-containing protein [Peribacillus simplex]MDP1450062.1 SH3 domain-containing protein [Peribacillus frigoritolerans]
MKKKSGLFGLTLMLIFSAIFPINHAFGKDEGENIVTTQVVNVREGAGLSFPIVKKLSKGESYPILNEDGDWIEIRIGAGKTGWVANWLVERQTGSDTNQVKKEPGQGMITGSSVRVRTGPGTTFQTVGSLNKGTAVDIIEKNENWIKVKTADIEGWVSSDYLRLPAASGNAAKKDKKDSTKEKETDQFVKTGVTLVDRLNVRSEPSKSSATLGKLNKNTSVSVYRVENEWAEIDFQGVRGWVAEPYIQVSEDKDDMKNDTAGATARVTATGLNVRKEASLSSKVIGSVNKDETYAVLQTKGNMTQIKLSGSKKGWVVSWYLEKENVEQTAKEKKVDVKGNKITIIHDGTILRSEPDGNSEIVEQANAGETFSASGLEGDWYSLKLKSGKTAYVAGWIVTIEGNSEQIQRPGVEKYLKDKTIVIDPGHGGRDSGTIGAGGTLEKNLTTRTAELLRDKLQAAGAKVILTRSGNTYVPLPSRVSTSHIHNADAFISLHYDSTKDQITSGITTYYYHDYQRALAATLANSLGSTMQVPNRGSRYGNFHVTRENKRVATLIELGYLSNPVEELTLTSNEYQEKITSAIYNGLARYFK